MFVAGSYVCDPPTYIILLGRQLFLLIAHFLPTVYHFWPSQNVLDTYGMLQPKFGRRVKRIESVRQGAGGLTEGFTR